MEKFVINNLEISILQDDITQIEADAIVNAANSSLMGGGGVDGAIHKKGGPKILVECREYRANNPPLPTGEVISTTAGLLPAKAVLHTVGPIWQGGGQDEPQLLANAYRNSLKLADEHEFSSIAFPSISTGIYGYPISQAVQVVKKVLLELETELQNIKMIKFVLFSNEDYRTYLNAFSQYLVNSEESDTEASD